VPPDPPKLDVAGSRFIELLSPSEATVVQKPWGRERWLLAGDSRLVLKAIEIRAGARTSLQRHERKEEVTIIVAGAARLVFGDDEEVLEDLDVGPGSFIRIRPGGIHRLEARTDLVLLELSTPEVDDVIRLSDDWSRGDGPVAGERSDPNSARGWS